MDPSTLSTEERRHVPVLTLPERVRRGRSFDLVIQVGPTPHVMEPTHRIDWVEALVGSERVFVADLGAAVSYPIVRVPLTLQASASITVRARCNLHGIWRTRRDVTVR